MKTVWFRAIILVSCISTVYSATASLVLNLANNVAAGNTVTYNCSSEGSGPDPRITWSIETNDRTVVRTNSQLSSSVVGGNENTADGTVKSSVTFVVESSYLTNHRLWCGAIDGTDTSPSIQIYTTIAATTTTTANLGGSCSTTVTCSTAFSSCFSSICRCNTGYYDNNGNSNPGGSCSPQAGLGGTCQAGNDLSCSTSNSQCSSSSPYVCECITGYIQSGSTCVLGSAGLGESCASPSRTCYVSNSYCNGICVCSPGYYRSGTVCLISPAGIGQSCINPSRACPTNAGCTSGICQCNSGYTYSSSLGYCVPSSASISQSCINPTRTCPTNAGCVSGICQCNSGYTYSSSLGYCVTSSASISQSCINPTRTCPTNAGCVSGICQCNSGYTFSSSLGYCVTSSAGISQSCINPTRTCPTNAGCVNGICQCNSDYTYSSSLGYCVRSSAGISESCINPTRICPNNAACVSGICQCNSGYTYSTSLGYCITGSAGISESCINPTRTCPTNAGCFSGICQCNSGYTDSSSLGNCVTNIANVGESCVNPTRTCVSNALCTDSFCQCVSGYYAQSGICYQKAAVGQSCSTAVSDSCTDTHASCTGSPPTCRCNSGYSFSNSVCAVTSTSNCPADSSSPSTVTGTTNPSTPSVTVGQTCYEVDLYDTQVLECRDSKGSGALQSARWLKAPSFSQVTTSTGSFINGDIAIPNLTVSNAQSSYAGDYVCQLCYGASYTQCTNGSTVTLLVRGTALTSVTATVNSTTPVRGSQVTFTCTAMPNGAATSYIWYFSSTQVSTTAVYTISSVGISQDGTYRCQAGNSYGTVTSNTVEVDVQYIPEPSGGTTVLTTGDLGIADIVITCNMNANPPVLFYAFYNDGDSLLQNSSSNTYIVTSSTGYQVYRCRGLNSVGLSSRQYHDVQQESTHISECTETPSLCSQGCTELQGGYECYCNETGYRLDTDQSTCVVCSDNTYGNNCTQTCTCDVANTLSCIHTNGTCRCKDGFDGSTCADDVNECADANIHQCPANSVCINNNGSFYCKCDNGYLKTGDGTCQVCTQGTYGENCNDTCECVTSSTVSCNHVSGTCSCKEGWEANDCSQDIDECTADTARCPVNSSCRNTDGSYVCDCVAGYKTVNGTCQVCDEIFFGESCATPCACFAVNTEVCDHVSGACTCKAGWEGSDCSQNINECSGDNPDCPENSQCQDTQGSYICACNTGYGKTSNGTCEDVDECSDESNNCDSNATCTNTAGNFTCACDDGFTGDGTTCSDVDECSDDRNNCDSNATCTNTVGSFTCICYPGYSGEGTNCSDTDECSDGSSNCDRNAECMNSVGSFTCACKSGYSGNGTSCTDIDECTDGSNNCDTNAKCTNYVGSFTCACNTGYSGNGTSCTDIDECSDGNNNCDTNAECTNTVGSFMCACNAGYSGNGTSCTEITTAPTTSQRLPTQTAIRVLLTLNITVRGNLSVSQTNSEYAQEVHNQLTFIYRERLLNVQFAITILRVWEGSLNVDYLIEILTSSASLVAAVTGDIGGGHIPVPVFGENASALLMAIGNITITPGALSRDALLCEVYQASVGSCEADFVCDVVDGYPLCQSRDTEDNLPLILGLGIGLPMFLLCVAAVVLFIVYFHNRRKLHGRRVYREDDGSGSTNGESRNPVRLNTRVPKGPLYNAPDLPTNPDYSRYPREPGQYLHTEYRMPYSNATEPESDNLFTWDSMRDSMRPGEKYHIKRPKLVKYDY